ncbi:MAG: hypothetical protein WC506_06560 [Candidatus Micrarchaeia archaeon]
MSKSRKKASRGHASSKPRTLSEPEYWQRIADLHSSHASLKSHLMHNLAMAGTVSPQRVYEDSLFLLSLSNAIADVLKRPSGQSQEKEQVVESYNRIVDASKALSENLYAMDMHQNASDLSADFAGNMVELEGLINDSSVQAISNGGQLSEEELSENSRRLAALSAEFSEIRRKLYSQPSSLGESEKALSNFDKIRKNIKQISGLVESMPEPAPPMLAPSAPAGLLPSAGSFEKFKVALVKSLIQLVAGKVLIDRKHVTLKSTHNGIRKSFKVDENARHALLDMFESTFVRETISEIMGGSDGVVVAQFEVSYEGAEPRSIHLNIGSRKHEGNSITFSPVSMYLPSGQVAAISSLDFETENS